MFELRVRVWLFFALLFCISGCGSSYHFIAPDPPPSDIQRVRQPEQREINLAEDNINKLATLQVKRFFDLSRHFRKLFGIPKQAMNVDSFGEVYDSCWFTNRNALRRLSLDEIALGPNTGDGPDTSGVWTVIRAKTEGVTPGFTIEDRRGDFYIIKFDPIEYSEMATGAEVVSTKLFHAAGYNVPENYIVYFHPRILRVGTAVRFKDRRGQKRLMTQDDLMEILDRVQQAPNGRIRAAASKYLPGKLLGPFKYEGVRQDDANDYIPHEQRRELRGLRILAAWLNHFDTKANNSLDVHVDEGYVRHYLIDFGSTLGSQGDEPMPPEIGHEGPADPPQIAKTIGSLGAYIRPWERTPEIRYPSIGYFESGNFQPHKYKYILPNPAFMNATNLDCFWGAKLVMSFTDGQIRAAVDEGQYSNPEAADYLVRTLIERRDILGRYWFGRVNPLGRFELVKNADGEQELRFVDLAVETGIESGDGSEYRYDIQCTGQTLIKEKEVETKNNIALSRVGEMCQKREGGAAGISHWEVKLQVRRGRKGKWSKWVKVCLADDRAGSEFRILRVIRED